MGGATAAPAQGGRPGMGGQQPQPQTQAAARPAAPMQAQGAQNYGLPQPRMQQPWNSAAVMQQFQQRPQQPQQFQPQQFRPQNSYNPMQSGLGSLMGQQQMMPQRPPQMSPQMMQQMMMQSRFGQGGPFGMPPGLGGDMPRMTMDYRPEDVARGQYMRSMNPGFQQQRAADMQSALQAAQTAQTAQAAQPAQNPNPVA